MEIVRYDVKEEQLYQYEPYPEIEDTKPTMNGDIPRHIKEVPTSSTSQHSGKQKTVCCFCFKTTKLRRRQYIVSFFTNVGIFSLLLGYTFLGSFIFLAIEGGNGNQILKPRMLPGKQFTEQSNTKNEINGSQREDERSSHYEDFRKTSKIPDYNQNYTFLNDVNAEARARTVENIWEITVSLNILYRENWTRLAGQEISRFQDELVQRVTQEMAAQYGVVYQEMALGGTSHSIGGLTYGSEEGEWSLAKAFFYSLTVLTTIGYGSIAPQTTLGKGVTVGYALFGIPLTMLYLTSVGSLLARVARGAFSKALCCCLCSNCGYCCYDERRMAEKERRMKLKRQQEEMRALQSTSNISTSIQSQKTQEPFFVKTDGTQSSNLSGSKTNLNKDLDTLSWPDTDSKLSMQGLSILAPILLCLCIMFIYIVIGTIVLFKLDNVRIVDGFYFCFMTLSTIGFGNLVPGTGHANSNKPGLDNTTLWFCSIYILAGLALTAMCFNVVHDEIIHRIKHKQKEWSQKGNTVKDEKTLKDPFYIAS